MEQVRLFSDASSLNLAREVPEIDDEEEEFCSCCGDENELKERGRELGDNGEDTIKPPESEDEVELDEFSVKMYFKGLSVALPGDSNTGFSGVGVVMERSCNAARIQVQKRLDFYVQESVADYLALMDGLLEAIQNKIKCVFAFTNSDSNV